MKQKKKDIKNSPHRHSQIFFYIMCFWLVFLFLIAVFAPVLAPNDPYKTSIMDQLSQPNQIFPLGTDELGRCLLSRVLYGARVSVFASAIVVIVVFILGSVLGTLAGYFGGWLDEVINRVTTIFQAFPRMILAIAVAGVLGIGIQNTVLALCVVYWTEYARLSRSMVLSLKERTFIKSAVVCGESHLGIIFRHIFPNIFPEMIVTATLDIGVIIMEISGLSFLGMGIKTPMAEWGAMMSAGRQYMQSNLNLILIPGAAIFITVIIFNLFGEKLRDYLDLQ